MVVNYHDFVLVIAALDAEWSRSSPHQTGGAANGEPSPTQCLTDTHDLIRNAVKKYNGNLDANHKEWIKGCGGIDGFGSDSTAALPIHGSLFSTQTWFPFGHYDALTLVAVDDLDAAQVLIETYPKAVEELTTAFCPDMQRYRDLHANHEAFFVDVLDLLKPQEQQTGAQGEIATPAQVQSPLLILTRLRITPLLTLARALTSQAAIYEVMAQCAVDAQEHLRQLYKKGKHAELYTEEEVNTLQVTFLDLQDEEEIGILVLGRNYSAMLGVVAAIQHLTLRSIITGCPDAAFELFSSRCLREVLNLSILAPQQTEAQYLNQENILKIQDNHVFRWSRSVAAASPHLSQSATNSASPPIGGKISIATLVGFMMGHQRDAERILSNLKGAKSTLPLGQASPYCLHTLGTTDLLIHWASNGKEDPGNSANLVPIAEAIQIWPQAMASILEEKGRTGRRDFTGWNSMVSIPVPADQTLQPFVGKDHRHVLHELMGKLSNPANSSLKCLDENKIRSQTALLGLPVSARRPLIFLAQNFHQVTSNALLFDVVLDFLDVLETLAVALCERLPDSAAGAVKDHAPNYTRRAPAALVNQLNELLAALDDALELRLRRIYPESPVRDWSLDLRSQNHQVLLGAEAVLKCAIAVFRKDVIGLSDEKSAATSDAKIVRQSLGVVLRLRFQSGIFAHYLPAFRLYSDPREPTTAGRRDVRDAPRLAIFEADFPHLSSIAGYADFYHESFHLIYDELVQVGAQRNKRLPNLPDLAGSKYLSDTSDSGDYLKISDTQQELFVYMGMLLFVFDGDSDLMLRNHLVGMATSVATAPEDAETEDSAPEGRQEKRVLQFTELFFHALTPVLWLEHVLGGVWKKGTTGIDLARAQKATDISLFPTITAFVEAAVARLQEIGPSYPDYNWLFGTPESPSESSWQQYRRHMALLYMRIYDCLPPFWFASRAIFAFHVERIALENEGNRPHQDDGPVDHNVTFEEPDSNRVLFEGHAETYRHLQSKVDNTLSTHWGLETSRANPPTTAPIPGHLPHSEPGEALDGNLIVRRCLYHYLKFLRRDTSRAGAQVALPRYHRSQNGDEAGQVDRKFLSKHDHNPFLIDRTAVGLFCCSPGYRRRRVGLDIAVLKTIWDIASRNRARRLVSLKRSLA